MKYILLCGIIAAAFIIGVYASETRVCMCTDKGYICK